MEIYKATITVETPGGLAYQQTLNHDSVLVRDKKTFEMVFYNLTQALWSDIQSPRINESLLKVKLLSTEKARRRAVGKGIGLGVAITALGVLGAYAYVTYLQ